MDVEEIRRLAFEEAAQVCEQQSREFLSPQYAVGQPLSSFAERFACGECAKAIRARLTPAEPPISRPDSGEPL